MVALKYVETSEALVGRIIAGKYRLLRVLGEGGMGAVFEAENMELKKRVAIKRLFPHILESSPNARIRFAREARISAEIRDPRIVEVFDVVEDREGTSYIVMELLIGESLAELIAREETLSLGESLAIVREVLEALAIAHSKGIVHRDIKPENIFVVAKPRPCIKLLDFGISKYAAGGTNLTATNAVVGSPYFMAPEQALMSKSVDHRSDLFATGAVLFHCLTGQMLFSGPSIAKVIARLVTEEPPLLRSVAGDAPPELEKAIDRALAPNPEQRYQSAAEMWAALAPFAGSKWRVDSENDTIVIRTLKATSSQVPREPMGDALEDTALRAPEPVVMREKRYEVRGLIGYGSTAEVYEVWDNLLNRSLALKKLRRDRYSEDTAKKLLREAQITAQLQHPNIMPVHDFGRLANDEPYFLMKRVHGTTLRRLTESIARGDRSAMRRYDPRRLGIIYMGIARAVAYAHEMGVVHCDLGTSNILITENGDPLVGDWGFAQIQERRRDPLIRVSHVHRTLNDAGSLSYLSPEQANGDPVDERTDIYALGAIMYEMLTLAPPFAAKTRRELLAQIKAQRIIPPSVRMPDCELARALEGICMKAMNVDPAQRFQTVAAMEDSIQNQMVRVRLQQGCA